MHASEQMRRIPLEGKTIVCLATQEWDAHWTPVQQVMLRLAPNYRVLYIEPFHPALSWFKRSNRTLREERKKRVPRLRQAAPNVWVYRPSHAYLPWNMRSRLAHRINSWLYVRELRGLLASFGAFPAVLWAFFAQSVAVLDLGFDAVVYDCVDDWPSFFPEPREKRFVTAMDEQMCRRADVVFVGSAPLYEKKRPFNEHVAIVNHAADIALFGKAAAAETVVPEDLAAIPGPRVGFIGMIDAVRFDAALIGKIATELKVHVVLVGGIMGGAEALIPEHPLIHPLGMRSIAELPAYLKGMDVLLMPYAKNEATRTIYPLKLYEYLATGKPVVTTDIPAVQDLRGLMYIAGDGPGMPDFLTLVQRALEEQDAALVQARRQRAAHHTWEAHVSRKLRLLGEPGLDEKDAMQVEAATA